MKNLWSAVPLIFAVGSVALAQENVLISRQDAPTKDAVTEKLRTAGELRVRMAVEGKITTGAPYSAEAVTESTQVLADGNRINRRSTTRVYRDSEGRTRREEVNGAGTVVSVSIVDPVARTSYVLEPESRTAYRENALIAVPTMMRRKIADAANQQAAGERVDSIKRRQAGDRAPAGVMPPPPPPAPPAGLMPPPPPPPPGFEARKIERVSAGSATQEDLGQQNIEGVSATGTRMTNTIAAGAIGNLQPLKIVSEQWFSSDLQLLVMTKHSDPRSGETIYRLQSIVRAEPDRSLFAVPPDYTLKEAGIRLPQ
jgi:hypothetical protein